MNKVRFYICKSKIAYDFHYANSVGNISKHLFVLFAGLGYTHKAVNHSQEYVTAEGVHTNHIESLWRDVKPNRKFVAWRWNWNPWMEQGVRSCRPIWTNGYGAKQRSMFTGFSSSNSYQSQVSGISTSVPLPYELQGLTSNSLYLWKFTSLATTLTYSSSLWLTAIILFFSSR